MQLISIPTPIRQASLTKFLRGKSELKLHSRKKSFFDPVYDPVVNIEHWTSAKTDGPDGSMMWCNGNTSVEINQVNWKAEQPKLVDGNCVFVQFSNSSANLTTFSLGDCAQERKFICEVYLIYLNV
jgi:hypothetical protein